MTERHDEPMTERLRGDGLLLLFVATCLLLACAWQARTSVLLWGLALGAFALHDVAALTQARRFGRPAARLQRTTTGG